MLHSLPLVKKKPAVDKLVLDKWFPLILATVMELVAIVR